MTSHLIASEKLTQPSAKNTGGGNDTQQPKNPINIKTQTHAKGIVLKS